MTTYVEFKFNMGDKVRDRISGFVGTVMGQYVYSTGCRHYGLAPLKLGKDGKIMEHENLDESRLILVESAKKENPKKAVGGPQSMPRMK